VDRERRSLTGPSQFGDHVTPVGHEYHLPALHVAQIAAEAIPQLLDRDRLHEFKGSAA
jgi:hypothetical protein